MNSVPSKEFFFIFNRSLVRKQEGLFLIPHQFAPQKETEVLNLAHRLIRAERVRTVKIGRCYMFVSWKKLGLLAEIYSSVGKFSSNNSTSIKGIFFWWFTPYWNKFWNIVHSSLSQSRDIKLSCTYCKHFDRCPKQRLKFCEYHLWLDSEDIGLFSQVSGLILLNMQLQKMAVAQEWK